MDTQRDPAQVLRERIAYLLAMAERFSPEDTEAYLTALADGLRCDRRWCDCGGYRDGHWPVMTTRCGFDADCICGGHFPKHMEA